MSTAGRINGWRCGDCGEITYCVHVDDGVTPMFLACRRRGLTPEENECKGRGTSLMYPGAPPPQHIVEAVEWEWYEPSEAELADADEATREHCRKGGLLLRPLTNAGREKLGLPLADEPEVAR